MPKKKQKPAVVEATAKGPETRKRFGQTVKNRDVFIIKMRAYPNKKQTREATSILRCCCDIRNTALNLKKSHHEATGENLSDGVVENVISTLRKDAPDSYGNVYAQTVQIILQQIAQTYRNYFKALDKAKETGVPSKVGLPKFKKYHEVNSFSFKQKDKGFKVLDILDEKKVITKTKKGKTKTKTVQEVRKNWKRVKIYGITNPVKVRWHQDLPGELLYIQVLRDKGRWFILFYCDVTDVQFEYHGIKPTVLFKEAGCDLGLKTPITIANEENGSKQYSVLKGNERLDELNAKEQFLQSEISKAKDILKELDKNILPEAARLLLEKEKKSTSSNKPEDKKKSKETKKQDSKIKQKIKERKLFALFFGNTEDKTEDEQETKRNKKRKLNKKEKELLQLCKNIVRKRIQSLYAKRRNVLFKISNKKDALIKEACLSVSKIVDTLYLEDLYVKDMMSRDPLKKNKASIRRGFQKMSLHKIKTTLIHMFKKYNKTLFLVNPAYTTQMCSNCGRLSYKPLEERTHDCPYCDTVLDRDVNAAISIMKKGQGLLEPTEKDIKAFQAKIALKKKELEKQQKSAETKKAA